VGRGLDPLAAFRTDFANQTLRHDRHDRTGDQERLHPISTSLVTALGASFVCNVLKTKCPVSDAWIAVFAVSSSRISPTRRMFGFLPEHGTNDACKRHPNLGAHLALIDAREVVLHRVFGRDDFHVRAVQLVQGGVERGRLPRPRRTVTSKMPLGRLIITENRFQSSSPKAEVAESDLDVLPVEDPHDHRLAVTWLGAR